MVAFQNDTENIKSKIGPIRNHEELAAAILNGRLAAITPTDCWLVAWFHGNSGEIEALEFLPIDYCEERWPDTTDIEGAEGNAMTIEVHAYGPCILPHPARENAS